MASAVLVAAAVALVYANSVHGPFVFDDLWTIRDQLHIRAPGYVGSLYTLSPPRFLVMLSFAVTYWFFGFTLWAYHVVNIALHAANAALVYGLMTSWMPAKTDGTRPAHLGALWATLGFALTPVHTQVVAYITGRAALLGTFWLLLTVLAYARARQAGTTGRRRIWYLASLACYGLGGFSKEITAVAPALILAWEWWGRGPATPLDRRGAVLRTAPYFLLLGGLLLYRRFALGALALPVMPRSVGVNLLTQSFVTWRYALVEFLPVGLTIDHDVVPARGWADPRVWWGLGLWAGAATAAWAGRKRAPWLTLGLAWFFLCLLPDSSVVPLQDIMADHRAYLPGIGLWAIAAHLWSAWYAAGRATRGRAWRGAAAVLSVLALALLAVGTAQRNTVWRDPLRLWQEAVRRSPVRARPLANLAGYYLEQQEYGQARETATRAIELDDRVAAAYFNRGAANLELGRFEEAESDISSFVALYAIEPRTWLTARAKLAAAHYHLGLVFTAQGRYPAASQAYQRALRLNPIDRRILNNLGITHEKLGEFDEAEFLYRVLVGLGQPQGRDWEHLLRIRRIRTGEAGLRRAVIETPGDVYAHLRLGIFYDDLGVFDQAESAYQAAAGTAPDEPLVSLLLGSLYRREGRRLEAIAQYRRALELAPRNAEALWWRGQLLIAQGAPFEARGFLEQARALDPAAGTPAWRPPRVLRDGRVVKAEPSPSA